MPCGIREHGVYPVAVDGIRSEIAYRKRAFAEIFPECLKVFSRVVDARPGVVLGKLAEFRDENFR